MAIWQIGFAGRPFSLGVKTYLAIRKWETLFSGRRDLERASRHYQKKGTVGKERTLHRARPGGENTRLKDKEGHAGGGGGGGGGVIVPFWIHR